ncbi:MAG: zinc-binding dehydrogenase [Chloroflexota bacterium]|nr:zinc-binding dehydrogenase [Anaerolineales bacterium]MCB8968798.1 alcohol dehydrogenase catalytic domain-containing protein [Ardenticatenaceae bacterium]
MKAIRLMEVKRPLQTQELPIPQVGPDDVLVQVKAAGICHSDAHYRAGVSPVYPLPLTLGHEVAGVVVEVGTAVAQFQPGQRVCLHYMATCGHCHYCQRHNEQFCTTGKMIGKYRDGGYAEYIVVPASSVFVLPDAIPFAQGAVLMCSSATALHALHKTRLQPGESVAIFGMGGLGMSAVQLAFALGAAHVYTVDIKESKLSLAQQYGATPINALDTDPVATIQELTNGRGVDVALELIGLPLTMQQAVQVLGIMGRAGIAGLSDRSFTIAPYTELLNKEAEIIGVSDHLAQEIPLLLDLVTQGKLDLTGVVSRTIPLDADEINRVLDRLDLFSDEVRVVIVP